MAYNHEKHKPVGDSQGRLKDIDRYLEKGFERLRQKYRKKPRKTGPKVQLSPYWQQQFDTMFKKW